MKTLKARLSEKLCNAYLLEGDDLFLFDKAFSMIKKACNLTMEDFNFVRFDDDNFSVDKFLDSTQVLPLVDEYRLILVKNVVKIGSADLKKIASYLENPVSTTVVVFYDFEGKYSLLKDFCQFVDCKRFDQKMATAIIVKELSKHGKQISQDAAITLLDCCNNYLTKAMNEIQKLIFCDNENSMITKSMVENCVVKENDFVVFELTEALGKKNVDKAISLASWLIKEQGIMALVVNHFRRMFFVSISDKTDAEIASQLGTKEFAVKKIREQSKNFSKMQLKKIFALLEEVDYKIKSGQMLSDNAFMFLIMKILYI